MVGFMVYQWMLAGGLDLKGLSQNLFARIFAYSRCGQMMYESEVSLARRFGYSREHINVTLKLLVHDGLIIRVARHEGLKTYDYSVNFSTIITRLGSPDCKDPNMLNDFYHSVSKWSCEEFLHKNVRTSNVSCRKSLQLDAVKSNILCDKISHNNEIDKEIDSINDNSVTSLSRDSLIEILYPIFFFKNNCNFKSEVDRFVTYYQDKGWTLAGGEVVSTISMLKKMAEAWKVKEESYTGFNSIFMKAWKAVYEEAPDYLKQDFLRVKTIVQSPTSALIKCPEALLSWLEENRDKVCRIFKSMATYNYKIEWR